MTHLARWIAGGAMLAPLLAFGHAAEFILARLDVQPGGMVELHLTADYAGNPLIPDAAAAEAALHEVLQVCIGDKVHSLQELAPLVFSEAVNWPGDTPAIMAPPPSGQDHDLLMGTWRWQAKASPIVFQVPRGSRHDALMWRKEAPPGSKAGPQWLVLIAGDRSPLIEVKRTPSRWWLALGLVLLLVVAGLQARRGKRRARRMMRTR